MTPMGHSVWPTTRKEVWRWQPEVMGKERAVDVRRLRRNTSFSENAPGLESR